LFAIKLNIICKQISYKMGNFYHKSLVPDLVVGLTKTREKTEMSANIDFSIVANPANVPILLSIAIFPILVLTTFWSIRIRNRKKRVRNWDKENTPSKGNKFYFFNFRNIREGFNKKKLEFSNWGLDPPTHPPNWIKNIKNYQIM
jgi:hypothetical protein